MAFLSNHPWVTGFAVLAAVYIARFVLKFIEHRKKFANLPGPPHSFIFGHLIALGKVTTKLPGRVHPHVYAHYLTKEYDLPPVFFVDTWPIREPMLLIQDPGVAQDIANSGIPKHPGARYFLAPLGGPENMVTAEGAVWKKWRSVFNPGFAISHLMDQIPTIVECSKDYIKILDGHAANSALFRLEEEATKLTIDVIGKVICDHDFKSLVQDNKFVEIMRKQLSWMPDSRSMNPFHVYDPRRPLYWKYYKRQMDDYVGKILDERFSNRSANQTGKIKKKTSIDLALLEYFKQSGQDVDSKMTAMSAEFRRYAIDNLEILLFAGHDTTASTICYCYHLLHKHPDKLQRIRDELDKVFGQGRSATEQLKQSPYLINKCDYTLAVVKEALRLWTPASSVRIGTKDFFVRDPSTGEMLPSEGCLTWAPSISIHRDTRYWGDDAMAFRPERFLPENADKLTPHAFRPFESGPRNCIGQELSMIEMKVVLAMTVREFDVWAAYDELDKLGEDGSLWATEKSQKIGIQECFDDEAWQILLAAAKPREGMPARVKRRTQFSE
ncbi:cytochrome P450 [Lophiotrema nucula]|uniref:Cytochrome P450 n=1 Tax=Lophiotrema nucula TaxID=690887 RepID=A0A6A5YU07_9PLEO|nr:cytochrome P450 [Lophiotrema nucula]